MAPAANRPPWPLPLAQADEVGVLSERLARVRPRMERFIEEKMAPNFVTIIARHGNADLRLHDLVVLELAAEKARAHPLQLIVGVRAHDELPSRVTTGTRLLFPARDGVRPSTLGAARRHRRSAVRSATRRTVHGFMAFSCT